MSKDRPLLIVVTLFALSTPAGAQAPPWGGSLAGAPSVGQAAPTAIAWRHDLETAKAEARQTNKLVLVHFWRPSCGPCVLLERRVFNQPSVSGPIQQKFVPVKINSEEHPAIVGAFGITQVPTDMVLTANGDVVAKIVSPPTPMAYLGRLTAIAAKATGQPGTAFQLAANQSPYGGAPNGSVANSAYANLSIPATPPQSVAGSTPAPSAPPAQPPAAPAPQVVSNAFAGGPPVTPQQPVAAPQQPIAPVQPAIQQPPSPPTASNTPSLPPGSLPLGFDGYCPVTMKQRRAWKKGDVKWGALHEGRTYLFAGQAERDAFLASPNAFSPVLSGNDPVLALEEGKSVAGKREFGVEYRETVYLFSSEATLNRFWSNPENYARGVTAAVAANPGRTTR